MKYSAVLALVAISGVHAHTLFSKLFVDGIDQGTGTCIRMRKDPSKATDPINDLSSDAMACGVDGTLGVSRVCAANSGSALTFEYRDWPDDASRGSIDISHKGPCAVYLKKVDSAISDPGVGNGWFKIWESGYDEIAGKWCTEKLIANNGHLSVQLPTGIQGGYYLVRPELLALHQADKTPSNPQFYVGCAQVFLHSTDTVLPPASDTVAIPGHVKAGQPSVTFNIWKEPMALPYPMLGPAIFSTISKRDIAVRTLQLKQTEGLVPAHCVLQNANWCGNELAKYSDENGCWNASTNCWDQSSTCYNTAPPTGSTNCAIWEEKCKAIQAQCNAGNFNGPPDYMKNLTPAAPIVNLPQPSAAQVGDGSYLAAAGPPASLVTTSTSLVAATSPASSASSPASSTLKVSTDGSCTNGITCLGSTFGDCCSGHNWCGSTPDYCGDGCQAGFGTCGTSARRSVEEVSNKGKHKRHLRLHGHAPADQAIQAEAGKDKKDLEIHKQGYRPADLVVDES
ncbi:hypothetical protein LTR50_006254 [Elasticomyces elasticus]|nr:hypothetical protein LTR50_006254 [Elasticomyces elasticus]